MSKRRRTIKTFDEFVEEAGMLLSDDIDFCITDPLEQYWFEVADKHGIIDKILEDDWDTGEP